jgi:hypothetical protein
VIPKSASHGTKLPVATLARWFDHDRNVDATARDVQAAMAAAAGESRHTGFSSRTDTVWAMLAAD